MTHGHLDPAQQWSSLLVGLSERQHAAVVSALRSSAEQGWPADAEGVRLLVAYANGEIDAQDYAVGILVSLGVDAEHARTARPERQQPQHDPLTSPGVTIPEPPAQPPAPRLTRDEAVAAYVAGRIPVEEFLRITRGVSA